MEVVMCATIIAQWRLPLVIVVIDPGLTGACAVLSADGALEGLHDTPTLLLRVQRGTKQVYDVPGMVAWRKPYSGLQVHVCIEESLAMPGQGTRAVTQKSPCKGKRVIMGEESALKLSQRGLDARQGGAHENPEAIIRPRTYDLST